MKNLAHIEIVREQGQPMLKVWLAPELKDFFIADNGDNRWDFIESDSINSFLIVPWIGFIRTIVGT